VSYGANISKVFEVGSAQVGAFTHKKTRSYHDRSQHFDSAAKKLEKENYAELSEDS
ncbi:uncharacterized protein METZ01_LOCUS208996, partial [marine metagenome]